MRGFFSLRQPVGGDLAHTFRMGATGAEGSGSNLSLTELTSSHAVGKLLNPTELSLSYKMGLVIISTPRKHASYCMTYIGMVTIATLC